mgnify:CR=1 FL=1
MKIILRKLFAPVLLALAVPASLLPAQVQAQSAAVCEQPVTVQAGDTLSTLATRYLGSALAYGRIVTASNAAAALDASFAPIQDPNVIAVGRKLCVSAAGDAPAAPAQATVQEQTPEQEQSLETAQDAVAAEDSLPIWHHRLQEGAPHPLTIDYLRSQDYPGSPITVEQTLAPGSNYNRYLVSYRSEGLKIYALMTVPQGEKPASGWPAIVFNHGYIPPEVYRPTERYVAYVDGFARSGYVVFRPDYRGHADSEGEPISAYGAPDYTIDVLNALASVRQHPDVDPQRLGMWGHSLGGFITVRAMVTAGDIKAGVIWAGVVASYPDILERWRSRRPPATVPQRARRWRDDLVAEFGAPEENPAFWASISANSYAAELSGPVQLHHGTNDADVPLAFSELLHQEILDAGGNVEFYAYEGDDHNLSGYFSTAMQRSIAFFDAHVKASKEE